MRPGLQRRAVDATPSGPGAPDAPTEETAPCRTATAVSIAVLPGDGIGTEVTEATLAVLEPLARRHGLGLASETLPRRRLLLPRHRHGHDATRPSRRAEAADAILLGAMGWPGIRYADGTEIAPQLDLRFRLNLYAGVRPIRAHARACRWRSPTRARGTSTS